MQFFDCRYHLGGCPPWNPSLPVVIEALKERKTMSALAKEFSLHPQQITDWKKQATEALPGLFGKDLPVVPPDIEIITAPLYQKIGKLEVELDFMRHVQKKIRFHEGTFFGTFHSVSSVLLTRLNKIKRLTSFIRKMKT